MLFTFQSNNPSLPPVEIEADDERIARDRAMMKIHGGYSAPVVVDPPSGRGLIQIPNR